MEDKPYYDKREQLQKIESGLIADERVIAVYDLKGGGSGFVGITTKRVIVYDKAFARKKKAIVSIPYKSISSIAAEDESGLLTGRGFFASSKIEIKTSGDEYELEFRGADKAHHAHNLIIYGMTK